MGVKDLWNILSPLGEKKPLFELQGKVIAIDLSCWVVDSQTVTDNIAQPKMYLRNLFFRTTILLMQGIYPVFVLEGTAPTLKHNTIAKRNDVRHGPRKTAKASGTRSRFKRVLNECQRMLQLMGLACVQGEGEAEATCAYLNADGLVDGCITQDSDFFLYGGKTAYRNFSTSCQGNRGATNGSIDEYNIEKITNVLDIGRNKMIALALLCGCDYYDGINGIGKEAALKFFKTVNNENVLERMKSWKTDSRKFQRIEEELSNPNICSTCGHPGKTRSHLKSGCTNCGTTVKCNDSYKKEKELVFNELSVRKKAILDDVFPNQELIDEFLLRKDTAISELNLKWKQPQFQNLVFFMEGHLAWEPVYAFEKVFALMIRWQLVHLPQISLDKRLSMTNLFVPEKIQKTRVIRCVASYEILWKDEYNMLDSLALQNDNAEYVTPELISVEPQTLVKECYPEIVQEYDDFKNATSKKKTKKVSRKEPAENAPVEKVSKPRKGKRPINVENCKKLDTYLKSNIPKSLTDSLEKLTISPKRLKNDNLRIEINSPSTNHLTKKNPQIERIIATQRASVGHNTTLDKMLNELSPDDFFIDTENDDFEMSTVIDGICKKSQFDYSLDTDNDQPKNEQPIEISSDSSNSETQDQSDTLDDFDIEESYVPLCDRIKKTSTTFTVLDCGNAKNRISLGIENLMEDTLDT